MKKKLTALVLSLVIAAMPAAAPVMNVQTVSAATTKAAVLKNTWSKDHKYYYDKNGKKVKGIRKIGKYTYIFDSKYTLVKNKKYYKYNASTYYRIDTRGRATKLSQVETLAAIRLQKCGGNLRKAFNWSASLRYNGTAVDSPVNADSFTSIPLHKNKRMSAGTWSPAFTFTTSPFTSSSAGIFR